MKYLAPVAELVAVETVNVLLASQPEVTEEAPNTCSFQGDVPPGCTDD